MSDVTPGKDPQLANLKGTAEVARRPAARRRAAAASDAGPNAAWGFGWSRPPIRSSTPARRVYSRGAPPSSRRGACFATARETSHTNRTKRETKRNTTRNHDQFERLVKEVAAAAKEAARVAKEEKAAAAATAAAAGGDAVARKTYGVTPSAVLERGKREGGGCVRACVCSFVF